MEQPKRSLNVSLVAGLGFAVLIIVGTLLYESFNAGGSPFMFLKGVSLIIVFGGMSAAALVMYPIHELKELWQRVKACIYGSVPNRAESVVVMVKLSEEQNLGILNLQKTIPTIQNPMVRESLELISMGFKAEDIKKYLETRSEASHSHWLAYSAFLSTHAKLGPGFGLVGTLIGLIVLLGELGSAGAIERIGPAMAVALTATLYGVIVANMVMQPLSEYMIYKAEQMLLQDQLIIEGAMMLKDKKHPITVRETLRSHLTTYEQRHLDSLIASQMKPKAPGSAQGQEAAVA
jgi:chemotaxis protein MotA